MRDLAGKNAIVTGASAGIGVHIARALAAAKVNLVLVARSADKLETLAAELRNQGVQAVAVPGDITNVAGLERLVEQASAALGDIDLLVNNAGVETYHHFHNLPVAEIEKTIQLNVTASLVLARLVLPGMLAAKRGHIVNMSSTAGLFGPAFGAAYGASKAALVAFTEALRAEYKGAGVSASVICPGFTNEGGMYERIKREVGRGTPFLVGATSAPAVAKAVLRAIRKDAPQIIVNSSPMRPASILGAISPRLGQWLVRFASVDYLRRIAVAREEDGADDDAAQGPS